MASLSTELFFLAVLIQGILFAVDEFYFHLKRGLPRWERIGHPIDTVLFLAPLLYLYWQGQADGLYWALTLVSCVVITKDEWVHARLAPGSEVWLHSVLFMLHPLVLITAGATLPQNDPRYLGMLGLVTLLMSYQIIYWNWLEPKWAKSP